jgi:DNA-binding response OmpR family regulator
LKVGDNQSAPDVTMAIRSARQRVLVLNDDAVVRSRVARIIGRAGYEVVTEGKAQASEPPDLVIIDLAKPQQETAEIIRTLRAVSSHLRILAMAPALNADALRAADLLGAQGVLTQPWNAVKIRSRVRTLLEVSPAVY